MSKTFAPANPDRASYRVPALEKGLDVLELLADSSRALRLTEIAERTARTKQELFRVLNCLHERGYLVRDRAQRYRISTKLFELGAKQASIQTLVARAMPHMERLAETIGESCHLNIVVGHRMLVVAHASSQADITLTVRVGASFPLHERNTGRVALAFLPEDRLATYWEQINEPARKKSRWQRDLDAIRERGFEIAESPITRGVKDCATPILGPGGKLLGVLCVSHILRVGVPDDSPHLPAALLATARAISAEFGPLTPPGIASANEITPQPINS